MMLLALTRLVEIVGESANRVSQAGQSAFPSVPWKQIIGMRNRLIHGYDKVDVEILWRTLGEDFPVLVGLLDAAIVSLESKR